MVFGVLEELLPVLGVLLSEVASKRMVRFGLVDEGDQSLDHLLEAERGFFGIVLNTIFWPQKVPLDSRMNYSRVLNNSFPKIDKARSDRKYFWKLFYG